MTSVEAVGPDDWERVRALRLAALVDSPDAFDSTWEREHGQPGVFWRERLERARETTLLARVDLSADQRAGVSGHAGEGQPVSTGGRGEVGQGGDAGLAVISSMSDQPHTAAVYSLWVAPWARGKGVGDALLAAAIARATSAAQWDVLRIVLDVGDHNAPAIRLYERFGFKRTGRTSALPPPRQHITEHERALAITPSSNRAGPAGGKTA